MNKTILLALSFLAIGAAAYADVGMNWNQLRGVPIGTIRNNVVPCLKGSSTCGSNPPVYQATAADCGTMIPGNSLYNQVSGPLPNFAPSNGGYLKLPTSAMLTAANKTQCDIGLVLPAVATQYICVDPGGAKFTSWPGGVTGDVLHGCVMSRNYPSGVVNFSWDNTSWIITQGTPNLMCNLGMCQVPGLAQGKLTYAGTDDVEFTPYNGNGVGINHYNQPSGGSIVEIPANSVHATTGSASLVEYAELSYSVSVVNGVSAGAANGAGGNYVHLSFTSLGGMHNGNTVECHNIQMASNTAPGLGTQTDNQWTVGNVSGTSLDLINQVNPNGAGAPGYAVIPSAFSPGDTWTSGATSATGMCAYMSLLYSSVPGGGHITDPITGVEEDSIGSEQNPIVGIVKFVSTHPVDTNAQRFVCSWFHQSLKNSTMLYTVDRSTSSVTYAQPNAEIQSQFVTCGVPANAAAKGAAVSGIRWTLTYKVANGTPANECDIGVAFNSTTTPEATQGVVTNSTNPMTATISGTKTGLAEGFNFATVLMKSPSGTSCTLDHNFTVLSVDIPQ